MNLPSLPAVSFRLTARDFAILERIRIEQGLPTRVAALREALREWERKNPRRRVKR